MAGPTVENADGWAIPMGSQVASLHEATEEENAEADAWISGCCPFCVECDPECERDGER